MGGTSRVSSYEDAQRALSTVRTTNTAFDYSAQATRSGRGTVHQNLNPRGKVRECCDTAAMPHITPIIMGMDVTRSRGEDAKTVYAQLLPLMGALYMAGVVTDPQIMFAAIGDATTDRAPLQVGQFESDERMDGDLERMWIEEGGGGTGQESYELAAYYFARKTKVDAIDKRGEKGLCFFTGDEAPYPVVKKDEVARIIGDTIADDIPTSAIFAELQARYRTFLIYPAKPLAERQGDIDAEIRQRLLKAGGRFEKVSIRASLIWNTFDDLDLHVVTPRGEEIAYYRKRSSCGGELDVDRNAGGPQTREPVENIRWAQGMASTGKYVVYVQNYAYHDREFHRDGNKEVPFKVELDIDGKIQTFEGKIMKDRAGAASNVTAFEFEYTLDAAAKASSHDHEAYIDEVILGKWRQHIPDGHIIRLSDAKWTTEAMLGVMAIQKGKTLEDVIANMHERAVAESGIEAVKTALRPLAAQAIVAQVDENTFS